MRAGKENLLGFAMRMETSERASATWSTLPLASDIEKRLLRGLIETLVVQPGRTIQPTLRVPRISDLGAKVQEGDGCVVRTQNPLVEVMGFEPTTSSLRTTRSAN